MSVDTSFGSNDPLTPMVWANRTIHEAMQKTTYEKHVDRSGGMNDVIVEQNDLESGFGDTVRNSLLEQLPDVAYRGQKLSDKSCKLKYKYEDIRIDCIDLCPVEWETKKTAQLRPNDLRKEAKGKLQQAKARLMDSTFYSVLAGDTLANGDPFRDGNNEICSPSKNRHCIANGGGCEEDIEDDPSALMTLEDVYDLRLLAENHGQCDRDTFRPIMVDGEEHWKLFLHPFVVRALKKDPCWKEVQLAAMAGGDIKNNPMFTGALGVWERVIFVEASRMPYGISKDGCEYLKNVHRSVLAGAGAVNTAYAGVAGAKGEWLEDENKLDKCRKIALSCYMGMKKSRFAPEDACQHGKFNERQCDDYATIVFSSQGCKPKTKPAGGDAAAAKKKAA